MIDYWRLLRDIDRKQPMLVNTEKDVVIVGVRDQLKFISRRGHEFTREEMDFRV